MNGRSSVPAHVNVATWSSAVSRGHQEEHGGRGSARHEVASSDSSAAQASPRSLRSSVALLRIVCVICSS